MIAHRPFGGTAFCRRRAGSGQVEDACENASVIEIVRESTSPVPPRVAIFDFDGTLSLIRSGWIDIMVPLCVEQLQAINTGESETELRAIVDEFIWRLTGKETIYQMMALADAVRMRGGSPLEPLAYKKMYLDRLWLKIRGRIEDLQRGRVSAESYLVPGARELLEDLVTRGVRLYLASGTDDANVKQEAALLGVDRFFEGRIFGAQDDLASFSKALLVQQIVSRTGGIRPEELLVFGDGFVEIEEVKKVGGRAIGLATAEPECLELDNWKRSRLLNAGADVIIANFLKSSELLGILFSVPARRGAQR